MIPIAVTLVSTSYLYTLMPDLGQFDWFGSMYYESLYCNRDSGEAMAFFEKVLPCLRLQKGAVILDAPCGSGRHASVLCKKGFNVTGVDISSGAIQKAKDLKLPGAEFCVHDIRRVFRSNYFDLVLNLFSSIGYSDEQDDLRIFRAASDSLKKNGLFLLDFLNTEKVISELITFETKEVNGVSYQIHRNFDTGRIRKKITVCDAGREVKVEENIIAYTKIELEDMLTRNGFIVRNTWGDYLLNPFVAGSDRLIFLAEKGS